MDGHISPISPPVQNRRPPLRSLPPPHLSRCFPSRRLPSHRFCSPHPINPPLCDVMMGGNLNCSNFVSRRATRQVHPSPGAGGATSPATARRSRSSRARRARAAMTRTRVMVIMATARTGSFTRWCRGAGCSQPTAMALRRKVRSLTTRAVGWDPCIAGGIAWPRRWRCPTRTGRPRHAGVLSFTKRRNKHNNLPKKCRSGSGPVAVASLCPVSPPRPALPRVSTPPRPAPDQCCSICARPAPLHAACG